jgi:hypothetical protein
MHVSLHGGRTDCRNQGPWGAAGACQPRLPRVYCSPAGHSSKWHFSQGLHGPQPAWPHSQSRTRRTAFHSFWRGGCAACLLPGKGEPAAWQGEACLRLPGEFAQVCSGPCRRGEIVSRSSLGTGEGGAWPRSSGSSRKTRRLLSPPRQGQSTAGRGMEGETRVQRPRTGGSPEAFRRP